MESAKPHRDDLCLRKIVHQAIPRNFIQGESILHQNLSAFRIRVNEELENLKEILEKGWTVLRKGGRMCVISFHSLEDRLVKRPFGDWREEEKMVQARGCGSGDDQKPLSAFWEEQRRNPRSRSAD